VDEETTAAPDGRVALASPSECAPSAEHVHDYVTSEAVVDGRLAEAGEEHDVERFATESAGYASAAAAYSAARSRSVTA
jgi:hypothetical protein